MVESILSIGCGWEYTVYLLWLRVYCLLVMVESILSIYYGWEYTVYLLWLRVYCLFTMVESILSIGYGFVTDIKVYNIILSSNNHYAMILFYTSLSLSWSASQPTGQWGKHLAYYIYMVYIISLHAYPVENTIHHTLDLSLLNDSQVMSIYDLNKISLFDHDSISVWLFDNYLINVWYFPVVFLLSIV